MRITARHPHPLVLVLLLAPIGIRAQSGAGAYAEAFARVARQTCELGDPHALDAARRSTRATLSKTSDTLRARALSSVDSAYHALVRRGGCSALATPAARVLITSFDGLAWDAPLAAVGHARDGRYDEDGFFVLIRGAKFAHRHARAVYTFTGAHGRERLITGRYRVPARSTECGAAWSDVRATLLARYPALLASESPSAPVRDDACGDASLHWYESFRNPETSALEAAMSIVRDARGAWSIIVDFPGYTMRR